MHVLVRFAREASCAEEGPFSLANACLTPRKRSFHVFFLCFESSLENPEVARGLCLTRRAEARPATDASLHPNPLPPPRWPSGAQRQKRGVSFSYQEAASAAIRPREWERERERRILTTGQRGLFRECEMPLCLRQRNGAREAASSHTGLASSRRNPAPVLLLPSPARASTSSCGRKLDSTGMLCGGALQLKCVCGRRLG